MKRLSLYCVAFLVLLLSFPSYEARAGSKSYPLMCRGGGTMKAKLFSGGMQIWFVGASQGAEAGPPRPGQCTWLDRGFRPGEPRSIIWTSRDLERLVIYVDAQGKISDLRVHGKRKQNYQYLYNSIRTGRVFQLHAYQPKCGGKKCGHLRTTKVGP